MSDDTILTVKVTLREEHLLLLDGRVDPQTQVVIDALKSERATREANPGLTTRQVALIHSIVAEAEKNRILTYCRTDVSSCRTCGKTGGYYLAKRTTNTTTRGKPDYNRPRPIDGVEFAVSSLLLQNHIQVGACRECVESVLPILKQRLAHVRAQIPESLREEGSIEWIRIERNECKQCGWVGPKCLRSVSPTWGSGGYYHNGCPSCHFDDSMMSEWQGTACKKVDGWYLIPASTMVRKGWLYIPADLTTFEPERWAVQ